MSDHICARCARVQKTCCQEREIYTTPGDVERIRAHIGRSDFYAFRVPDNPDYLDQDDDPEWRDNVFRADNSRRTLNRQPNGDCTFLGPVGCVLPTEVRPIVCRMYPYDYTADGILPELSEGCPTQLLDPGVTILQALDMRLVDAERWHQMLYAEIQQERNSGEGPPMKGE